MPLSSTEMKAHIMQVTTQLCQAIVKTPYNKRKVCKLKKKSKISDIWPQYVGKQVRRQIKAVMKS